MSLAPQRRNAAARPLQYRLLRGFASELDLATRAALKGAIAAGASGNTTTAITAEVLRRLS